MREVPCPACDGARFNPFTVAVTVAGRNIAELSMLSIRELSEVVAEIELTEREIMISEAVLKEVRARLGFLLDVGPRLPLAGAGHLVAQRRRGPAHPAGQPDRLGPGRGALRARRAVDRAPPA